MLAANMLKEDGEQVIIRANVMIMSLWAYQQADVEFSSEQPHRATYIHSGFFLLFLHMRTD